MVYVIIFSIVFTTSVFVTGYFLGKDEGYTKGFIDGIYADDSEIAEEMI